MNDSNDSREAAKKDDWPKKSTRRSLNSGPTTGSGDKRELVKSRNFTQNRNLFSFEKSVFSLPQQSYFLYLGNFLGKPWELLKFCHARQIRQRNLKNEKFSISTLSCSRMDLKSR